MCVLQWPIAEARPDRGPRNAQGWGGADATAALRDAGDAGAALASRALELEAELAALDHSMMQVTVTVCADLHSHVALVTIMSL